MAHNIISMDSLMPQDPRKILILVDYSNILYRAYFSCLKELETKPWLPFVRLLDMLRTCVRYSRGKNNTPVEFIFCGDSVRKKLDRMKVDENYKADRPSLSNLRFYIFRNVMKYVLDDIGCPVIFVDGQEGDDVIASITHSICQKCDCEKQCAVCKCSKSVNTINDTTVVIFSNDRDLNVLLEYNNTVIYRPPSIFYSRPDFIKDYGFHPKYFPFYKALVGDKSDDIKGVPLWGERRAREAILKRNWEETLMKSKAGYWDWYQRNLALVKLNYDIPNLPSCGGKAVFGTSSEMLVKLKAEYRSQECIDDVIFAEKRLEEACNVLW